MNSNNFSKVLWNAIKPIIVIQVLYVYTTISMFNANTMKIY